MKTVIMILCSFLLLNACRTQDAKSKSPEVKIATEKKVELGSDNAIIRRDAFKKAKVLPKEG